jgi:hypothetical protein
MKIQELKTKVKENRKADFRLAMKILIWILLNIGLASVLGTAAIMGIVLIFNNFIL